MVTEYLQGESVGEILKQVALRGRVEVRDRTVIEQCGANLAKVHKAGFSLIDTQPVNCIWAEKQRQVYFTDLEFCTRDDKRIWDVGFFLCFLTMGFSGEIKSEVKRLFVESYQWERQINLAEVDETNRELKEYLPIFQTILDIREFTPEELLEELKSPWN